MSSASSQHLSVSDLQSYGQRFGINYLFPAVAKPADNARVLSGSIQELSLSSGLHFTYSNLQVLTPYESSSLSHTMLFLLIVLEGVVKLSIAGQSFTAQAGTVMVTRLDPDTVLRAFHAPQKQLRTITIALDPNARPVTQGAAGVLESLGLSSLETAQLWQIPNYLYPLLSYWQSGVDLCMVQQRLFLEGLLLQLLAHRLGTMKDQEAVLLAPSEQKRLEHIRQGISQQPHLQYSLSSLAEQAAMSTSSFRAKFRRLFGQSVFDYLRDQRLAAAREYLLQGYSVQQAANFSGYHHATNFATAFRKQYGIPPSSLR